MKWKVDEMASWWNDKLIKWQVHETKVNEMKNLWNGKLVKGCK
jgi:hypothetical protein